MGDRDEELREILQGTWNVWMVEFGLTHSVLQLAVHRGTYPRHLKVQCSDCVRVEADVQGGPYALSLSQVDWYGAAMWELRSADGAFRIVCDRVRVVGRDE